MPTTHPSDPPAALAPIAARVERRLRDLLESEAERWGAVDASLREPLDMLAEMVLAGGKRLRPAFCHWAYVGAGGDPDDAGIVDVGAAFELLHAFALVHDDVMDGSASRRGVETTHLRWATRHTRSLWRGEARRFGEGVAILVGDLAFVYADVLFDGAPPAAVEVFNELRIELNVGQYLDVLGTARGDTALGFARRVASYKSGKYTVERPLHVGAALAGRLDELVDGLSAYGLPLGEAFQLRDDLLGAFGDSSVTGKPVGDDLREGKPTPLLSIATARATRDQKDVLASLGDRALDDEGIAALQEVLVSTGACDEIEARIAELTGRAVAAARALDLTSEARDALAELATYVAYRDR